MKYIASAALMLNLGVATVYAQQNSVYMTFSGDAAPSIMDLKQPNTRTGEQNLTGDSALGPFTFRLVRASATSPQPSSTCSKVFFPSVAGAGLFRFQDGSLLMVNLTGGGDCIDPVAQEALCTMTFQVTGGTGRFKNASGVLTLTEVPKLLVADALGSPLLFTETGEITGTVSGAAVQERSPAALR